MREAFLCVLVHPDGRTEFRIFGERTPTKPFDVLCAVLAEAQADEYDEAARAVKRQARAYGMTRNPQLAAFLDEDDRYTSEMTGATIGSDGTVRRQDGEPVVFPSFQGVSDALAPRVGDAPNSEADARNKAHAALDRIIALSNARFWGKALSVAADAAEHSIDIGKHDDHAAALLFGKGVLTASEQIPTQQRRGDALARGTVVHEYIECLLAVVREVRKLASCHVDMETGACHTHGGKCPYEPARMALADLDAHDHDEVP